MGLRDASASKNPDLKKWSRSQKIIKISKTDTDLKKMIQISKNDPDLKKWYRSQKNDTDLKKLYRSQKISNVKLSTQ